ncbi:hypothetical protein ACLBXB_14345 [Methylobacterium mesophilicum]
MSHSDPNAFTVPLSGAQESKDGEADRYRVAVQEIWNRGFRWPGQVSAELNRLRVPSRSGRPWKSGAAADLLQRFGLDRKATEKAAAEALDGSPVVTEPEPIPSVVPAVIAEPEPSEPIEPGEQQEATPHDPTIRT